MTHNHDSYLALTPRHTEKEIAALLGVGTRTVRRYAQHTGVRPKIDKYRKKSNEEWVEEFNLTYRDSLSIGNVSRDVSGRPVALITCRDCGTNWSARLSDKLANQTGCTKCHQGNFGNRYTAEQVVDLLNQQHADQWGLVTYGEYSQKSSTIKCSLCDNQQLVNLSDMINTTSRRCTNCQTGSFGEYVIRNTLRFNQIPFESEVRIDAGRRRYRLDFLIDDAVALEYSGMQHFEQGRYFNEAVNHGVLSKQRWALDNDYQFHEIVARRSLSAIIEALATVLGRSLETPTPEFFATSDEAMLTVLAHLETHSARQTTKDLRVPISKIHKFVQLAGYESVSAWQAEHQKTQQ